ncbi:MAG: tungsten ABC transporter substrate-binding protein, partial [Desulfobacteraceae bacterium]|nr:tungsten ABC transporter substrate-binding protein [Desulfobacteraceae bacterium]
MYGKKLFSSILVAGVLLAFTTCALANDKSLMMATTTSTDNTGLL